MSTLNAWNTFFATGKVNDYLNYCRATESVKASADLSEREQGTVEVFDRRIDNKRE